MNRRYSLISACCILLCCAALTGADIRRKPVSENYRDDQTGLVFPSRLGTFFKTEVTKNRNPVIGSTIHYQDENDSVADVYIYSLREDVSSNDVIAPEALAKEHDSVVRIILDMASQSKLIESISEIPLQTGNKNDVFFNQFEIIVDGVPIHSRLVMFLSTNKTRIIKCRISYPAENAEAVKAALYFEKMLISGLPPEAQKIKD